MALDLSKTTPPPRKQATKRPAATSSKMSEREEAVNGLFQIGTAVCMMTNQHADGAALATHGPNISREAASLAEHNESFAKSIDYITAVGPYAGLLTACMPLILQIMVNHKRLPAAPLQSFGVVDPAALEAQAKRDALRAQQEMMREIAATEAEMARLSQENGNKPAQVPA